MDVLRLLPQHRVEPLEDRHSALRQLVIVVTIDTILVKRYTSLNGLGAFPLLNLK